MTAAAPPAGPAPIAPDPGDDRELANRLVPNPVATTDADLDDAFAGLAALLLDLRAASRNQGDIPTPSRAAICPDAKRRGQTAPPPAGGEAA